MTLSTLIYLKWAIIVVLTIFHCFVTYFVFLMRKRKNKSYQSHFFLLYLMMSAADILTLINNFFVSKFPTVDSWKQWFFDHPIWGSVCYMTSGYLIYFQSFLHVAIAVNRIYVSFSLIHGSNRLSKFGEKITWLILLLPVCILFPRFWGHTLYAWTATGNLSGYYVEPFMRLYHVICGQTIVISASLINFVLTMITIFRYRFHFKTYQQITYSMKQDILLFCQGLVTLCFQLSLAAYYVMTMTGTIFELPGLVAFAWGYVDYVLDGASLANPISLLIVCKFVRKDFFKFLHGYKPKVTFFGSPFTTTGGTTANQNSLF